MKIVELKSFTEEKIIFLYLIWAVIKLKHNSYPFNCVETIQSKGNDVKLIYIYKWTSNIKIYNYKLNGGMHGIAWIMEVDKAFRMSNTQAFYMSDTRALYTHHNHLII